MFTTHNWNFYVTYTYYKTRSLALLLAYEDYLNVFTLREEDSVSLDNKLKYNQGLSYKGGSSRQR